MNQRFALKKKGYTENDYKKIVEEFAGEKLDSLFKNYFYGLHSFESILVEAFESIGLAIKMTVNPNFANAILGVKTILVGDKIIVSQISPGSSADLGKIMMQDEIISVNGFKVNNNLEKWVEYFKDTQIELSVMRAGRMLNLFCPHTNKSYFPI